MSRTEKDPAPYLHYDEKTWRTPWYKLAEQRGFYKPRHIKDRIKALERSERRAAKRAARQGIEKTDNPHFKQQGMWY